MAQERALQDTNMTNMASAINFYQKEKKIQKRFYNSFLRPLLFFTYNSEALFH